MEAAISIALAHPTPTPAPHPPTPPPRPSWRQPSPSPWRTPTLCRWAAAGRAGLLAASSARSLSQPLALRLGSTPSPLPSPCHPSPTDLHLSHQAGAAGAHHDPCAALHVSPGPATGGVGAYADPPAWAGAGLRSVRLTMRCLPPRSSSQPEGSSGSAPPAAGAPARGAGAAPAEEEGAALGYEVRRGRGARGAGAPGIDAILPAWVPRPPARFLLRHAPLLLPPPPASPPRSPWSLSTARWARCGRPSTTARSARVRGASSPPLRCEHLRQPLPGPRLALPRRRFGTATAFPAPRARAPPSYSLPSLPPPPPPAAGSVNYAAVLDTAVDVARAMVHLHRSMVLHSDLKV
jgi:hypothetical protein